MSLNMSTTDLSFLKRDRNDKIIFKKAYLKEPSPDAPRSQAN